MSELLNTFDLQTILLVLVFTAIAIREGMELYHYFHQKIYGRYQREDNEKDTINDMQATLQIVLDQVKQIYYKKVIVTLLRVGLLCCIINIKKMIHSQIVCKWIYQNAAINIIKKKVGTLILMN